MSSLTYWLLNGLYTSKLFINVIAVLADRMGQLIISFLHGASYAKMTAI